MRDVVILGSAMTHFGRHLDKTHTQLGQQAITEAMADAGVAPRDLDIGIYANVSQGVMSGEISIPNEYTWRPLGITGIRAFHVEAACASGTQALHLAYDLIRGGSADVVVTLGVEKTYSEDRDKKFALFSQAADIEEAGRFLKKCEEQLAPIPAGQESKSPNVLMEAYAAHARLHITQYGTTQEEFAAVSSKSHYHSQFNPLSQYQKPMSVEEILAAKTVAWPLTIPMCAPISDGAASVVLCAADIANRFKSKPPVQVAACGARTGTDRDPMDFDNQVSKLVAADIYEKAGIGPEDIDVAEVHDASAAGEIAELEALGFCKPGEAGKDAIAGNLTLGGRIPINTSGGLVSKGHPIGATGLGQVHELVLQLRGEAENRQVENARIALAQNNGGFYGVEEAQAFVTLLKGPSA